MCDAYHIPTSNPTRYHNPEPVHGQVGLGVGSWLSNRTTRGRLSSELDYTS